MEELKDGPVYIQGLATFWNCGDCFEVVIDGDACCYVWRDDELLIRCACALQVGIFAFALTSK